MSNISRSYPFQLQYKSLVDSPTQPEKTTEQEICDVDSENAANFQALLEDIDNLILQMERNRKKLSEQPALCEFFLELIYTQRSELNKKMLNDQLAFFDSSGELVRKENHEITRRIVQLFDLESELEQMQSEARESISQILTPAEQRALRHQLAKTPPILKFGETYFSAEGFIDNTCTGNTMVLAHETIKEGMAKLFDARAELAEVMKLIESSTRHENQQLFTATLKKLDAIHQKMDGFINMLSDGAEIIRQKKPDPANDIAPSNIATPPNNEVPENSKIAFYQSVMGLTHSWEDKVTYFNAQYIGLLIGLSGLMPQNDKQRFDINNIAAMLTVLQDISAIKDNMAAVLGGVTEADLAHLLEDMGINSGEVVGSIALINIGSDVASMLKDALLGCFITLQTAQERQGMMTPEQLSNMNNMMAHFDGVVKKIASFSSTKIALSQLIKTAGSLLSVLAKMFR